MKEFEICLLRTPEEDEAVQEAAWRRYPEYIKSLRMGKELDTEYVKFLAKECKW